MRLYIDPGKEKCAMAVYEAATLTALAWATFEPTPWDIVAGVVMSPCSEILWEKPQIYPGGKAKKKPRPNDILDLAVAGALVVGAIASAVHHDAGSFFPRVRHVAPRAWKGQLVKPVHHLQLWKVLTEAERALFPADTYDRINEAAEHYARTNEVVKYSAAVHNLLDAAALGCYDLRRLAGPIAGRVTRPSIKGARKAWRTRK